jgi:hypothetical protein
MTAVFIWIALALGVGFAAGRWCAICERDRLALEAGDAYQRGYDQGSKDALAAHSYGARAAGGAGA